MSGSVSLRTRLVGSLAAVVTAVPVLLAPAAQASTSPVVTRPVNLRAQPLTVTTTFLPDAQVGYAYNVQLSAVGGTAPYTWSAAALPAGFELSKTGVLGGIPRDASINSSLAFTVVDAKGSVAKSGILSIATLATPTGRAWAWGDNKFGTLGNANSNVVHSAVPEPVILLSALHQVADSGSNAMALRTDGTVAAWGDNSYSELGTGNQVSSSLPVSMPSLSSVRQVSSNGEGGMALRTDGTVWAWGYNGFGQLGNGQEDDFMDHAVPTQVPGLPAINAVAACGIFNLALAKNGTVYAWGEQFQANGFVSYAPPALVPGLTSVRSLGCSLEAAYALRNDGTLWAWGDNTFGELGIGSTADTSSPTQVYGITSAIAVAGGGNSGYALLADGTVKSWGDNSWGQLGAGINTQFSTTPVAVTGLSAVRSIAGGYDNGYALRTDGSVWAWGDNEDGELGNGTYTIVSNAPAKVPSLKNVVAIGGGVSSKTPLALVGG